MAFNSMDNSNQTPNREQLLQLAIRTAKGGNATAARVMFRQVLADDKNNERALMWMAKMAVIRSSEPSGARIEKIDESTMCEIHFLARLIDDLATGKSKHMNLRQPTGS